MHEGISFRNRKGLLLSAVLILPEGVAAPPVVVLAHEWGSSKASPGSRVLADALVAAGIAAFLLDLSGHGESEGDLAEVAIGDHEDDLREAIELLSRRAHMRRIGVAGGGPAAAVALAVAASEPRVAALVLRAPGGGVRLAQAAHVTAPTLVIHGDEDVLIDRTRRLVAALACEHCLCTISGTSGVSQEARSLDTAVRETVQWFRTRLSGSREDSAGRLSVAEPAMKVEAAERFADRTDAGRALAKCLRSYQDPQTLVVALPRGGATVGEQIACALGCDLDVVVSRKLRVPLEPELAMGALAEDCVVVWNEDVIAALGVPEAARRRELDRVRQELDDRVSTYRAVLPRATATGRTVIVTDDGVATGATLRAAIAAVRHAKASRIMVALPGGPAETLDQIARLPGVSEVVALVVPDVFWAVGQLYDRFPAVSTEEVCDILRRTSKRRQKTSGGTPTCG